MDLSQYGFRKDYNPENKIVKQENIEINGETYFVSTVDLGIDYNSIGGSPLYFETMIFPKDKWSDIYCDRYETRKEAEKGHEKIIADIKADKYEILDGYFALKE